MAEPNPGAAELGRLVRAHRQQLGWSLEELARRTGLNKSTIHRMENGQFDAPRPLALQRLARAMETDVEDYFALIGYFTPKGLPNLQPYLRSKYDASEEEAREIDRYFTYLRDRDKEPPQQPNDQDAA